MLHNMYLQIQLTFMFVCNELQICHTPISDAVVDVIFHIFDTDHDGVLSMEEFLGVLQRRERDLADPTDTGIVQFLKCWWNCTSNCQKPWNF